MDDNMLQSFGLRCLKGNRALSLCWTSKCPHNSIICTQQECECNLLHDKCINIVPLKKLRRVFVAKQDKTAPLREIVKNWCLKLIKLIHVEMDDMLERLEKERVGWGEAEKRLWEIMMKKEGEKIEGRMVADAMGELEGNGDEHIGEVIGHMRSIVEKNEKQFEAMLKEASKMLYTLPASSISPTVSTVSTTAFTLPPDFKFSRSLSHPQLTFSPDSKTFTNYASASPVAAYVDFNLLQTPTPKHSSVQFRILNMSWNSSQFGVCQITPDISPKDENIQKKMICGALSRNDMVVQLGKAEGHVKKSSNIKLYERDDVVEVKYEGGEKRVTVKNLSRRTESVSEIKVEDERYPLYFVVISTYMNKVEIVRWDVEF